MSPKTKETPQTEKSPATAKSPIEFKRSAEQFVDMYANSVALETSLWDTKLIFGQIDQRVGPNIVVQHTGITLPWPQIKMLHFALTMALIAQEAQTGRIQLIKGLVREVPEQMPKPIRDDGSISEETWSRLRKAYEDFIAANPEISPK